MKHVVVAMYDLALVAFAQPFCAPTVAAARRAFQDEYERAESPIRKHPEDYELYQLAVFHDGTGEFVNEKTRICRALDFV